MMTLIEKATIIHYHRHRLEEYEEGSYAALGYRAESSQTQRFAQLCQVDDLNHASILDVGCGYGDLKAYIDQRFFDTRYIGIDQMAEFIQQARQTYGQRPSCYFCVSDFTTAELPKVDYVLASGVLNYRCSNPDFYRNMIAKFYQCADKALAFNMLDKQNFPEHELLIGHDPTEILNYCKTLSNHVQVQRGYLEDDFTVCLYK